MADIKYLITVDAQGAIKSVKDFDGAIDNLGKQSDKAGPKFGGLWAQVVGGIAAYGLAKKAGREFVDFLKDSVNASMKAEDAERNLEAALQTTGRTIEPLKRHFMDYSSVLQRQTKYGDEAIQGTQALLLQLTKLDRDGIDAATRGAIGLASVFKTDLQSATNLVSKALAGNYGALSRYGITVTETLSPQEKQRELLEKLNVLFGRAQAETGTFAGALAQLKNAWGDVQEKAGDAVTKNEALIKIIKELKDKAIELIESGKIEEWAEKAAKGVKVLLGSLESLYQVVSSLARPGGNPLAYLADELSGASTELKMINQRVRDAKKAAEDFRDSLIYVKPSIEEMGEAGKRGAEHYARYKERLRALDEQLIANKGTISGWLEKAADWLKITKAFVGPLQLSGDALAAFNKAAEDAKKRAKDAAEAKQKLADAARAIIDEYQPLHAAMHKVFEKQLVLNKALKAGAITAAEYKKGMDGAKKELRSFGETIINTVLPAARNMQMVFEKAASKMKDSAYGAKKAWIDSATEWVEANKEKIQNAYEHILNFTNQIDALSQASLNKKLAQMDKEYQARLDAIKKSTMSEEEKNQAIEALESEYNMRRETAQQKAASQQKLGAIAQAIISTYEAAAKALTAGPLIGPILAGIITAMGLLQVAKIKSTPVEKGAIFHKPALLQSMTTGKSYEVAEAGEAEIVSSPRRLREAIMGGRGRGGDYSMSRPIIVHHHHHLILDGREMKEFITQAVMEFDQLGRMKLRKALA